MTEQDIRDFIRKRILKNIPEPVKCNFLDIEHLKETQWCDKFFEYAKNRMVMGAIRYGTLNSKKHSGITYDYTGEAKKRIRLYEHTGNTEYLMDATNMMMMEYVLGKHPNKHFESIDDGEHAEPIK